jgi:iron complex transport system substrate-binding protein
MRPVLLPAVVLVLFSCAGTTHQAERRRVVCLVPSVTEIIYAIGVEGALVGNTNQCDYPEAARKMNKVGDFLNPDVELIVMLRPGLVIATLPVHRALIEKLTELKVPVYVSRPAGIEDVLREIDSVGQLLGAREQAAALARALARRLAALPSFPDTKRVFVEISSTPLVTAGGPSFINELVTRAGGRNVFGSALQDYPVVDGEAVVRADPEVVLVLHPDVSAAEVVRRVGWSRISAVRAGRVYDGLDEDLLFRPGPRIVDGIELLAGLLHQ